LYTALDRFGKQDPESFLRRLANALLTISTQRTGFEPATYGIASLPVLRWLFVLVRRGFCPGGGVRFPAGCRRRSSREMAWSVRQSVISTCHHPV